MYVKNRIERIDPNIKFTVNEIDSITKTKRKIATRNRYKFLFM